VEGGVSSGSGIIVGPKFGISAFSRSDWIRFFLKHISTNQLPLMVL